MNNRAGLRKEYKKHFTIDEAKLRRIADIIREHSKKLEDKTYLKFYVERENDAFYETQNIDEVLADDNVLGQSIRIVLIELLKETPDVSNGNKPESEQKLLAYIAFSRFRNIKVGFFVADKDRDWCFLLADELDTQINRLLKKVPFLFIPLESIDIITFFGLGGLILGYLIFLASQTPPAFTLEEIKAMSIDERTVEVLSLAVNGQSASGYIAPIMLIGVALIFILISLKPVERILGKLSRSVFYWGDMAQLHNQFESWIFRLKWGICIAFVVSLAASIAGAFLLKG